MGRTLFVRSCARSELRRLPLIITPAALPDNPVLPARVEDKFLPRMPTPPRAAEGIAARPDAIVDVVFLKKELEARRVLQLSSPRVVASAVMGAFTEGKTRARSFGLGRYGCSGK